MEITLMEKVEIIFWLRCIVLLRMEFSSPKNLTKPRIWGSLVEPKVEDVFLRELKLLFQMEKQKISKIFKREISLPLSNLKARILLFAEQLQKHKIILYQSILLSTGRFE